MANWEDQTYGRSDALCWALFAPTCFIVILRLFCRAYFSRGKLGRLGLDDYITAVCVILFLITCIFISIGSDYGLGKHQATLSPYQIQQSIKWNAIINSLLIWTFSLPKFAIIAILKRILDYGTKTSILFWTLGLSSQACFLATSIWWFAMCQPVAYQWDRSIEGGSCAPVGTMLRLAYATSIYSAFLDLFFAFYPIPFIMRLNMPLKNRVAVCIALGLSALAFIVSIYKLVIFKSIFDMLATDATYPVAYLDILGLSEGAILIICASLPTLGPLFRLAKGKITTHRSNPSAPHESADKGQARLGARDDGGWSNFRGHKLMDPENGSTTEMHASVDDIPLVSVAPCASNNNKYDASHQPTEYEKWER